MNLTTIRDKHVAKISKKSHQWAVCAFDSNTWPCDTKKVLNEIDLVVKAIPNLESIYQYGEWDETHDTAYNWIRLDEVLKLLSTNPHESSSAVDASS